MSDTIPIDSDVLVEWEEPIDEADGTFVGIDATGLVSLVDSDGDALEGAEDLEAEYVAGPPRRYQATIPNTVELTAGTTYYIEFALTASGGTPHGFRRIAVVAAYDD